jgi:hypothetical protein
MTWMSKVHSKVGLMNLPWTVVVESSGHTRPTLTAGKYERRASRSSTFLRPFARRALPRVIARMDALTPERRFFVSLSGTMNAVLSAQVSLLHAIESSDHSVSNHPSSSRKTGLVSFARLTAAITPRCVAPTRQGSARRHLGFTIPCRLTTTTGRIEFVILRTSHSSPVALHLVSRQRSYGRLQNSNLILTRTCTSLIQSTHKRTGGGHSGPPG